MIDTKVISHFGTGMIMPLLTAIILKQFYPSSPPGDIAQSAIVLSLFFGAGLILVSNFVSFLKSKKE